MAIITHPKSGIRMRLLFAVGRVVVKPALVLWPFTDLGLRPMFLIDKVAELNPGAGGVARRRITLAGRPTDVLLPTGVSADETNAAILYLHGGGFIGCGPGTHRHVAGLLARQLGLPAYVLDYRQLPEAGVGTSVDDARRAYRELLQERGIRRIIVAGDSAGGYLCGKVIELAHTERLPKPVAYLGFSPLLDVEVAYNPNRTSSHDSFIPKGKLARLTPKYLRGPIEIVGAHSVCDVSTEAFPPTLITTAQDELLEPDAIDLIEKLSAAGVVAQLHSYPWQLHAFPVMGILVPESQRALSLAADFARDALASAALGDLAAEQTG